MIRMRKTDDRGHFDHGWLDTYHTFSFGNYHDPVHMGFRSLRVINDDRVQPGQGFGMHSHRDMEIITCVLDGALQHRDSLGNGSVLRPGELQHMTAGTGVRHSEFNPSDRKEVHLYQIWLLPERKGLEPSYEKKRLPRRNGEAPFARTASNRNGRTVLKNDYEKEYRQARAKAQTAEYQQVRRQHPGIERKLSELVRHQRARRARYRGQPRVLIHGLLTALVTNVKRMVRLLTPAVRAKPVTTG